MYTVTARARQDYLFPMGCVRSSNPADLQLELTGIRHDQLLKEQAQIQRYVKTSLINRDAMSRDRSFAIAYQREVKEKQLRIAQMLKSDMSYKLQQQKLRKTLVEQQLNYQSMVQQMQLDQHHLLHSHKTSRLNSYKPNNHILASIDNTSTNRTNPKNMKSEHRNRSLYGNKLSETFEGVHIGPKQDKKQILLREYERNTWSNRSEAKENQNDQVKGEGQKYLSFRQIGTDQRYGQSMEIKSRRSQSEVQNRPKNKVAFDLSNVISSHQSQQANTQILNPNQPNSPQQPPTIQIPQSNLKTNAQTKIQSRINLSQTIYRDSHLKNIKHELIHLTNTYHNEIKLRHALKTRINNEPKVIDKYSLVVQTAI